MAAGLERKETRWPQALVPEDMQCEGKRSLRGGRRGPGGSWVCHLEFRGQLGGQEQ